MSLSPSRQLLRCRCLLGLLISLWGAVKPRWLHTPPLESQASGSDSWKEGTCLLFQEAFLD